MTKQILRTKQKNIFYKDPLDQWVDDHPYLASLLGFILVWSFIVVVVMLSWSL